MSALGLWLIAGVAILTIVTGLPAYVVLLLGAVAGAVTGLAAGAIEVDILRTLASRLINLLENDLLQALPLFLLMGLLLDRLAIAEALFKCGTVLFGRFTAAPVMSGLLLGGLLGPMNGSVGASVSALARTLGPPLARAGVAPSMRESVVAVAGTLGVVVPPSLVLILLGDAMLTAHTIAVNVTKRTDRVINTQDLMRGALLPAAIFVVSCLVLAALSGRFAKAGPETAAREAAARETPSWSEVAVAGVSVSLLVLLLAAVATGRLYAVEAAAGGAVALFVAAALSRRLSGGALSCILQQTLVGTGTLFAPLLAATTFTLVLRLLGTDKLIEAWIAALPGGPAVAVIVILAALAVLAFALDAFEIIFVAVPILVPALLIRVEDAVWIGVLVLLVLQASFLLPPLGYAWVLARALSPIRAAAGETVAALAPFLVLQIALLALVVAVPSLVHVFEPPGGRSRGPAPGAPPVDVDAVLKKLPPPPVLGVPGGLGLPPFGAAGK